MRSWLFLALIGGAIYFVLMRHKMVPGHHQVGKFTGYMFSQ